MKIGGRRLTRLLRRAVEWGRDKVPAGARTALGIVLVVGGLFGFLPVLGFWMIPVGGVLIALAAPCTPDNTAAADEDAVKGLSRMRRTGNSRLMVAEDGRLVGIVALKDMLNLLALKMDLEEGD